jgi:hypothetical protein
LFEAVRDDYASSSSGPASGSNVGASSATASATQGPGAAMPQGGWQDVDEAVRRFVVLHFGKACRFHLMFSSAFIANLH